MIDFGHDKSADRMNALDRTAHICRPGYRHLAGMREFYHAVGIIATSETADVMLIRSHIAYWSGNATAERAVIKPSHGHSSRRRDRLEGLTMSDLHAGELVKSISIENLVNQREAVLERIAKATALLLEAN